MIQKFQLRAFIPILLLNFYACKDAGTSNSNDSKKNPIDFSKGSSSQNIGSNEKGILGIFDVPEMLSLCKLDSANMKDVAPKISVNFSILEKDLAETGSELDGAQGIIYYNNNPGNFKFECFLLIKKMPHKKPLNSQIVVLESSKMLIYNYYGPYENTFKAYEEIKEYCNTNKYEQCGPLREFYPTNQSEEKDPERFFIRIMVPVVKKKQSS